MLTETGRDGRRGAKPEPIGIGYRLPDAAVQQLSGLIDSLTEAPYHGRADLPHLADEENLVMDELFPLIETLQLLGFAHVSGGDIELTALGRAYAEADMLTRKQMFRRGRAKSRSSRRRISAAFSTSARATAPRPRGFCASSRITYPRKKPSACSIRSSIGAGTPRSLHTTMTARF